VLFGSWDHHLIFYNLSTKTDMALAAIDITHIVPLVTGGSGGIGLGLVKEFLKHGAPKVLITGRREDALQKVAEQFEGKVFYKVSDSGKADDRVALLQWTQENHPDCNALINNAGIQRRVNPVNDNASWEERAPEIEINFAGPVHLSTLFIPFFLGKPESVCILATVSSGLAFVPFCTAPVYGATAAALHSYTMAMRYSLQDTNVRVVEIIPPAVKTNLGGSHDFGEDCDEYCAATMARVAAGEPEVGYKYSDVARAADRATLDDMMLSLATTMNVQKYPAVPKSETL
jgi:uncharacterized oxidoreductase